jgi:hydroxyacyl-ACP dehydratase HTD2-like protein with hotdog domain
MHVGDEIAPVEVTPDRWLTVRYAGASGDFNPIHTDDDFARAGGLPGRVLHGLWTMAMTAKAATSALGGDPRQMSEFSVQFRGIGFPEQPIAITGRATEADDDEVVLAVEARQEDRTLIRNASARIHRVP